MKISNRAEIMPSSPIRKLSGIAQKIEAEGIKVYHLNIGQPDLPSPQIGLDALKKIDRKVLEYTPSTITSSIRSSLNPMTSSLPTEDLRRFCLRL